MSHRTLCYTVIGEISTSLGMGGKAGSCRPLPGENLVPHSVRCEHVGKGICTCPRAPSGPCTGAPLDLAVHSLSYSCPCLVSLPCFCWPFLPGRTSSTQISSSLLQTPVLSWGFLPESPRRRPRSSTLFMARQLQHKQTFLFG